MAVPTQPEGACSHAWQEGEDVAEAKERAAWHEAMNRRNITPPERLQVCSLRLLLLVPCWCLSMTSLRWFVCMGRLCTCGRSGTIQLPSASLTDSSIWFP